LSYVARAAVYDRSVVRFRRFYLTFLIVFGSSGLARDARLDALRSTVMALRRRPPHSGGTREATPQLTVAKHQLRDWVESRLAGFAERDDEGALERRLNAELRGANLSCGEDAPKEAQCPDWSFTGFLEELKVRRDGAFLIVQTGAGIECGYDESAYLYSWSGSSWRWVWQNEQNDYAEKAYRPQTLDAVLISPIIKLTTILCLRGDMYLGAHPRGDRSITAYSDWGRTRWRLRY
jgi:hypothetical protein